MNLIEPAQWDSFFDLHGGGRVYFGRSSFGSRVRAGLPPIMAKIEGLTPQYPDKPFIVSKKSMLRINREFENSPWVPDWLRADCFQYHYKAILRKAKEQESEE